MFEKEIKFISDFSINKVRNEGQAITFERLTKLELHPAILQFISGELDYLIYDDRKRLLQKSIFDYSGSEISKYFNLISKEIKKTKKIPVDDIIKLIMQGTAFNANFVTRPRWTLMKLIFNDDENKSIDEVKQLLSYVYYYDYLKAIISDVLDKRSNFNVNQNDLENIIKKIDEKLIGDKGNDFIENALYSMGDFYNEGESSKSRIPFTCIETFLKEKQLDDYLDRIKFRLPTESKQRFSIDEILDAITTLTPSFKPEAEPEVEDNDELQSLPETGVRKVFDYSDTINEVDVTPEPETKKEQEVVKEVEPVKKKEEPKNSVVEKPKEEIKEPIVRTELLKPEPLLEPEMPKEPEKIPEVPPVQAPQVQEFKPEAELPPNILPVSETKEFKFVPEAELPPNIMPAPEPPKIIIKRPEQVKPKVQEVKPPEKPKAPEVKPEIEKPKAPEVKPEIEKPKAPEVKPEIEKPKAPEVKPEIEKPKAPEVKPEIEKPRVPEVKPEIEKPKAPEVKPEIEKPKVPEVKPEIEKPKAPEVKPEPERPKTPEIKPKQDFRKEQIQNKKDKKDRKFESDFDFTTRIAKEPVKFSVEFGRKKELKFDEDKVEEKLPPKEKDEYVDTKNENAGVDDEKKFEELLDYFSKKDSKKIISSVFNEDEKDFRDTLRKIVQCTTYEGSTEILKEVYQANKVNPYSTDAIKLTNAVSSFFNER